MALPVVFERSSATFRATFIATNNLTFTPTSARYRVDSADGTELVAWTELTPATSIEITVGATANRILIDSNASEVKRLTVQSDYGTENQKSREYEYQVKNLGGFTS